MIRLIYNLLFPIGLLVFLPAFVVKMRRRGNYRRNFGQRFGVYGHHARARRPLHSTTWIHAVSVGEVAIALKLAARMHQLDAAFHCVLTTTTSTGFAFAEAEAPAWMHVMYNPLDFWPVVQRAFAMIRPSRIILVEAEMWPNLAAAARGRAIPLALVNARLSERSERRFRKFRRVIGPTFRCLDLVCAQERRDIERWEALGIPHERIKEVGSIKYDPSDALPDPTIAVKVLRRFRINPDTQPILLGGSTHPGEEEILARTFIHLREEFPTLVLLIAPRHVERTRELRAALEGLGLSVGLRSEAESDGLPAPDCLLLDTTGELRNWYSVATVVFIGKSLTARGGQNPVEPILADKPVVFGPNMQNFASLARALVAEDAAMEVRDENMLNDVAAKLLRDDQRRARMVRNAERVLAPHRGATQRTAELLMTLKSHANRAGNDHR
jgi:3-deoxy-D-manno-octulosonic-acid transferase